MMPSLPPLNLSASSKSGDLSAPSTVYFGGFGSGSGGGGSGGGDIGQYLPVLAVAAVLYVVLRRKP